jgi:ribosomal protein L11 methyltransferase
MDKIKDVLSLKEKIILSELKDDNWQQPFEAVDLGNGWIIAEPDVEVDGLKKINFQSRKQNLLLKALLK